MKSENSIETLIEIFIEILIKKFKNIAYSYIAYLLIFLVQSLQIFFSERISNSSTKSYRQT